MEPAIASPQETSNWQHWEVFDVDRSEACRTFNIVFASTALFEGHRAPGPIFPQFRQAHTLCGVHESSATSVNVSEEVGRVAERCVQALVECVQSDAEPVRRRRITVEGAKEEPG